MNCCSEYGGCTQGPDCPARQVPHEALNYDPTDPDKMRLPAGATCGQCIHIARCTALFGHVESDTHCDWSPSRYKTVSANPVPPEAGNFQILDLGPDDDGQPLGHDEAMALVRTLLLWLLAVACTVTVVSVAVGYTTERWPDVLWAYLAALS